MRRIAAGSMVLLCMMTSPALALKGDASKGARAFRACSACHSLEPNRNMTGPSLAGVWDRKAGTAGFTRYSDAMKGSDVTWDEKSLDGYLKDPARFMPGNHMTFPGIPDDQTRADVVAFLKAEASGRKPESSRQAQMPMMPMGRGVTKLKTINPSSRVKTITYCGDTFAITTADGNTRNFWERNLRFKTDSSEDGPDKDAPAIVAAGMMGDRASIIFARPEEISAWIKHQC